MRRSPIGTQIAGALSQHMEIARIGAGRETQAVPWYALRVKPRHERASAAQLSARGAEVFAPLYVSKRRWSDRVKQLELPLFPGYLFCRFRTEQRLAVLTTPGVASIVGFGSVPIPVSDEEIESVRAITRSGLPYGPWPYVRVGDSVRIDCGCMSGMRGTLVRVRDDFRVVVNVELLQRSVALEIDRGLITLDAHPLRHSA